MAPDLNVPKEERSLRFHGDSMTPKRSPESDPRQDGTETVELTTLELDLVQVGLGSSSVGRGLLSVGRRR